MSVITEVRHSPNYSTGRPYGPPNSITIHHWGVDGQDHDAVAAYLCREDGSSSAHFVASAGKITQLVSPDDRAWHAGPDGNPRSIGIECRPEMSAADMATVAALIAELRARYGNLPLYPHQYWMPTACPGRWTGALAQLDALARGEQPSPPSPTTPIEEGAHTMFVAKTTTPWGTDAYALITETAGASALDTSQAQAYAGGLGHVGTVPWDYWNLLIREAWQRHSALLTALGREVTESVDQAVGRIINALPKEATK